MKHPLILLYYSIHANVGGRSVVKLYPSLMAVRKSLSSRAKRRKMTWQELYDSGDVCILRCYGRYDRVQDKVVKICDEVSKRALMSDGI